LPTSVGRTAAPKIGDRNAASSAESTTQEQSVAAAGKRISLFEIGMLKLVHVIVKPC
jgi:hypothetical protein